MQGTLDPKEKKYFLLSCLALSKRIAQKLWANHCLIRVRSAIGLETEGEPPRLQNPRGNCYSDTKALGRCPIQGPEPFFTNRLSGKRASEGYSRVVLYLMPLKYSGHGLSTRAPGVLWGQQVPIWSRVVLQ